MDEERFKKFISPGYGALIAACVVAVLTVVVAIICWDSGSPVIALVIGFAIALCLLWSWFSLRKDYNRFLGEHRAIGDLDQIVQDFSGARSWFDDKLRTGEDVLYSSSILEYMIPYQRILNMHQYVHSTNGGEDRRNLVVVLSGGKKEDLCPLPLRGKADAELAELITFVRLKNPDVTIGYDEARKVMRS